MTEHKIFLCWHEAVITNLLITWILFRICNLSKKCSSRLTRSILGKKEVLESQNHRKQIYLPVNLSRSPLSPNSFRLSLGMHPCDRSSIRSRSRYLKMCMNLLNVRQSGHQCECCVRDKNKGCESTSLIHQLTTESLLRIPYKRVTWMGSLLLYENL